ncbi:MAG: peptidase M48 Ste24p [Sphingomonadales bacterium]|nr:MAG: peptidase M48 Ste24p [Sphingomonadales bacterium]
MPEVSQEDHDFGAEQHPKLLASFGGEYPGEKNAYVQRLGGKIAAAAGLEGQCTFTLVNSDVVNAFAVPGCYIYVTRGLMAIVTSEAELASVLGHEVGHIVARHSARQQNRSLWQALGVIVVSLAGSERLTQLASVAANFLGLRYSRTQEYEADDLGIRYVAAAGYDPYAAADMLAALGRHAEFLAASGGRDAARAMPEWASSHPLAGNRVERATETAQATQIAHDALPENEAAYLGQVDGLLYGDDPQQGFVMGRRFAHPVMRIGFEAPEGFTLTNSPQAIGLAGPGEVRGEFGGGELRGGNLEGYARQLVGEVIGDMPAHIGQPRSVTINGLPALIAPVDVQAEGGTMKLAIAVYDAGGGHAYHFVMVSPPAQVSLAAIDTLFGSFHLLGAADVARLKPRVIRVVTAGPGDSAASLAGRVADPNGRALFTALNGDIAVKPGARVKIVVAR